MGSYSESAICHHAVAVQPCHAGCDVTSTSRVRRPSCSQSQAWLLLIFKAIAQVGYEQPWGGATPEGTNEDAG